MSSILNNINATICPVKTKGDRIQNKSLNNIGGKGLFIKEVEKCIINEQAHIAVHSMKDLEWRLNAKTKIGAVLTRSSRKDVFISKWDNIEQVPKNILIGTSSVRRKAFLLAYNPNYKIAFLRGNINSRLKKLFNGQYDAIVLAEAGIKRLGIKTNYFQIPERILPPSACQGALAIQCLKNNNNLSKVLKLLNDENSFLETMCERKFVESLNGNCSSPISASAKINNKEIFLKGAVAEENGSIVIKDEISGYYKDAEKIGAELGKKVLLKVKKNGSFL